FDCKPKAVRFGILQPNGYASMIRRFDHTVPSLPGAPRSGAWHFDGKEWKEDALLLEGLRLGKHEIFTSVDIAGTIDAGVRLRDRDGDGICELIVSRNGLQGVFKWAPKLGWEKLTFTLPGKATIVDEKGHDNGVRFIDLNEDGHLDVVFSNENGYGAYL